MKIKSQNINWALPAAVTLGHYFCTWIGSDPLSQKRASSCRSSHWSANESILLAALFATTRGLGGRVSGGSCKLFNLIQTSTRHGSAVRLAYVSSLTPLWNLWLALLRLWILGINLDITFWSQLTLQTSAPDAALSLLRLIGQSFSLVCLVFVLLRSSAVEQRRVHPSLCCRWTRTWMFFSVWLRNSSRPDKQCYQVALVL